MVAGMWGWVANLTTRRAKTILAVAVGIVVLGAVTTLGVANHFGLLGLEDPSSESSRADALIQRATGNEPTPGFIALVPLAQHKSQAKGQTAALLQQLSGGLEIHQVEETIESDHAVGKVTSALEGGTRFLSRNRSLGYLAVEFRSGPERTRIEEAQHLSHLLAHRAGVKVGGADLGTAQGIETINHDALRAELLSFPILLILSILFFRGLVAAVLPVVVGASAIVLTRASLGLTSHLLPISALVLSIITALSIGLAIDYSLLIVSRFREELLLTPRTQDALARTMATAGRTVLFSALTVVAALCSLLVLPQQYFYSMGLGGATATLTVCAAALTVLPAILMLLGPRINSFAPAWLQRPHAAARPASDGRWFRFASAVMRRPITVAIGASALLLTLGAQALGMKLIPAGAWLLPTSTSVHQVSDALNADFNTNPERTIPVVALNAPSSQLANYRNTLKHLPGTTSVTPVQHLKKHTAVIYVTSAGGIESAQAQQLVARIRNLQTPFKIEVTGLTAQFMDLKASLDRHLPLIALLVIVTTSLSIFLLTGSVVLPPKMLLMNALTLAACFGVLVLVFQHGYLRTLFRYPSPGAIEIAQPVLLAVVVFGISMDYGVFMIARIREIHETGVGNEQSIALGLERTGRITTTAALLLGVAVGSLATSRLPNVREVSLGIAVAVLLDATVVRALLVPALMRLLGERNWWSPKPLRRLHRKIGLSEDRLAAAPRAP